MKENRKKEINEMAEAISGHYDELRSEPFDLKRSTVDPRIINKKAEEIIATRKLEIPVCKSIPVNGRIYVISVSGADMKTPGGLILPPTFNVKKNEDVEGIKRYFVVAWDAMGIPKEIRDLLRVGIEVHPLLPDAEGWTLPRVIDWMGNNIFEVLHYTELNGVSSVQPDEIS